uniref:ATP-dependent RNA helicase n=1 Tax=Panagrolaimus sp. PS1159 TaxID=55785 RepID=A0AC35FHB2_9BILA
MFDDDNDIPCTEEISTSSTFSFPSNVKAEKVVKKNSANFSNAKEESKCFQLNSLIDDESSKEVKILRESIFSKPYSSSIQDEQITVRGGLRNEKFPDNHVSLNTLGLVEEIVKNLKEMQIFELRKLQQNFISLILKSEQDIVVCAEKGHGKTTAYLLPVINNLALQNRKNLSSTERKPTVIILLYNPESAEQVYLTANKISQGLELQFIPIIGTNNNVSSKLDDFEGGDIIIGTIKQLAMYVSLKKISLDSIKTVIYDETDIFFKQKDWEKTFNMFRYKLPYGRRTFVFSSTYDDQACFNFYSIARCYFWFMAIGELNQVEKLVQQTFIVDKSVNHDKMLINLIIKKAKNGNCPKTLVFTKMSDTADWIAGRLRMFKDIHCPFEVRAAALHSAILVEDRDSIFDAFMLPNEDPSSLDVLVISDKNSCGTSIPAELVVNYDIPYDVTLYILRVGCTNRNEHRGEAYTFLDSTKLKNFGFEYKYNFYCMLAAAKRTNHTPFPQVLEKLYQKFIS